MLYLNVKDIFVALNYGIKNTLVQRMSTLGRLWEFSINMYNKNVLLSPPYILIKEKI